MMDRDLASLARLREMAGDDGSATTLRDVMEAVPDPRGGTVMDHVVLAGSGNVFADLGLTDPEGLLRRSNVATEIIEAMRGRDLDAAEVSRLASIDVERVRGIMTGRLLHETTDTELRSLLRAASTTSSVD